MAKAPNFTQLPPAYHNHSISMTVPGLVTRLSAGYHERTLNLIVTAIPEHLKRCGRRLTNEEAAALNAPRTEWVPFRDYKNAPPKEPVPVFVTNERLPVEVVVRLKGGNRLLRRYDNMQAFRFAHKATDYPVIRTVETSEMTIILVNAKPWAKDHDTVVTVTGATMPRLAAQISGALLKDDTAPAWPKGGRKLGGRSKVLLIADMLLRDGGCTRADVLAATGWPSVSMPAQAKLAGLTLQSEKLKGQPTRYWATKKQ